MNPDELLSLIKNRRSVRHWSNQPVEDEKIKKILVSGMYAPSGANCQKVRFHVVRDPKLIAEISCNASDWFRGNYPDKIIIVLFDLTKKAPMKINYKKPHKYWFRLIWQDTAAAMMNMMLMGESLGIKTCWVSVRPNGYEKKIRNLFEISKDYVLASFLFLGYSESKIDINTFKHWGNLIKRDETEYILQEFKKKRWLSF